MLEITKNSKIFYLFIDESGASHLNNLGDFFILSTVIIDKNDFSIIQGYLRLLKRQFLGKDMVNLHMTDLCERTYMHYRPLLKPKNIVNSFLTQLISLIKTVPFFSGLYVANKKIIRKKLDYKPAPKKQLKGVHMNLPYQITITQAFRDFAHFLTAKNAFGEIRAESRFTKDADLIHYFDEVRKIRAKDPNQKIAEQISKRINSITISNKRMVDGGLELADIGAYSLYRKLTGDPLGKLKVKSHYIYALLNKYKKKSYLKTPSGSRIGVHKIKF